MKTVYNGYNYITGISALTDNVLHNDRLSGLKRHIR